MLARAACLLPGFLIVSSGELGWGRLLLFPVAQSGPIPFAVYYLFIFSFLHITARHNNYTHKLKIPFLLLHSAV